MFLSPLPPAKERFLHRDRAVAFPSCKGKGPRRHPARVGLRAAEATPRAPIRVSSQDRSLKVWI